MKPILLVHAQIFPALISTQGPITPPQAWGVLLMYPFGSCPWERKWRRGVMGLSLQREGNLLLSSPPLWSCLDVICHYGLNHNGTHQHTIRWGQEAWISDAGLLEQHDESESCGSWCTWVAAALPGVKTSRHQRANYEHKDSRWCTYTRWINKPFCGMFARLLAVQIWVSWRHFIILMLLKGFIIRTIR